MKFMCLECDQSMDHDPRKIDEDGSTVAQFACPQCGRRIAMLTNPMEAGFVQSLGDEEQQLGLSHELHSQPQWTLQGRERLEKVPRFVRAMVRKIYTDWAAERGINQITPAVMDAARSDLGLEGM